MSDEELREKVACAIRGDAGPIGVAWDRLPDARKQGWLDDADRAIALCREHYGGEVERLRRERDFWKDQHVQACRYIDHALRKRALRKEDGDD